MGGVWSIPSHQNYPADAQQHLGQAATTLIGLEILGVASTKPGEHELYGVLDPDPKTVGPGSVGIGTRVTMKDGQDNTLADLIIGKEVKDQPGLRYVRKAGRDQVYRVLIKTDTLSTKFGDWIEKDLLKLNPLDIRSVQLNDYSSGAGRTADGRIGVERELRNQIILDYDDTKNAWTVGKLIQYDADEKPVPADLEENEELNNEKLAALKTALDDLQIVDVERKPAGMKQLTALRRGAHRAIAGSVGLAVPTRFLSAPESQQVVRPGLQRRRSDHQHEGRRAIRAAVRPGRPER